MSSTRMASSRLAALRSSLLGSVHTTHALQAYIIPTGDSHQSEYLAACDKRREFISGFTGSNGTAIITNDHAALWTDGRYYEQAERELDLNVWQVMKTAVGSPAEDAWLKDNLTKGSNVGVDPSLLPIDQYKSLSKSLRGANLSLIPVSTNLVDSIWNDRPSRPANHIMIMPVETAGEALGLSYGRHIIRPSKSSNDFHTYQAPFTLQIFYFRPSNLLL